MKRRPVMAAAGSPPDAGLEGLNLKAIDAALRDFEHCPQFIPDDGEVCDGMEGCNDCLERGAKAVAAALAAAGSRPAETSPQEFRPIPGFAMPPAGVMEQVREIQANQLGRALPPEGAATDRARKVLYDYFGDRNESCYDEVIAALLAALRSSAPETPPEGAAPIPREPRPTEVMDEAVDAAWEAFQRPEGTVGRFGGKQRLRYALRAFEAALRSPTPGFTTLVAAEIAKARAKHRGIYSMHEGYAVILEELDELWDEIRAQKVNRDKVLKELVQVAAMCQRFGEDCGLLRSPTPEAQAQEERGPFAKPDARRGRD